MTPEELLRQAQEQNQVQPANAEDVLPKARNISGDETTRSVQESGSVSNSAQTGQSVQVGSQSGTSETTSGIGQLTPEQQAERAARAKAAADANGLDYDPETGKVTRKASFVLDTLGVDPAVMKKNREEETKLNERKQKESAWFEALSTLLNIGTMAIGGDVYKREPNNKSKEAKDRNIQLLEQQNKEDRENADKLNAKEREGINAVYKAIDDYNQIYAPRTQKSSHESNSQQAGVTSQQSTSSQQSRTTATQATNHSPRWWDIQEKRYDRGRGRSGSGGGSGLKTIKIPYVDSNGEEQSYDIDIEEKNYDAMGKYVSAAYNNLSAEGKKSVNKKLKASGINPKKDGTYETDDLLASGVIFEDEAVLNEFKKVINSDPNLSDASKDYLINTMRTFPVEPAPEEKRNIIQRFFDSFKKKDEEEQPAATGDSFGGMFQG